MWDIATFFYGKNESGWLDFEDGCFSAVEPGPGQDGGRYSLISQLTEKKEGKEKAELVQGKVKEVHKKFKQEQREYKKRQQERVQAENAVRLWEAHSFMEGIDDQVHGRDGEGHANGHADAGHLDLINTQLQQPCLDNRGMVPNHSYGLGGTAEPSLFHATNPLPSPTGAPDSLGMEIPGSHTVSYGAGQCIAHNVPFPNSTAAGGSNPNTGNQMEPNLLQQLVNALQQANSLHQQVSSLEKENHELKRKNWELEAELLDHRLNCPGTSQPSKRRFSNVSDEGVISVAEIEVDLQVRTCMCKDCV